MTKIFEQKEGLLSLIEDKIMFSGLTFFNEFEISEKFEELLYEDFGKELFILAGNLPLYINSNWKPISERILRNEGHIKIATYENPKLPRFLTKEPELLDNLGIYKLNKNLDFSCSLLYNFYEVFSNKDKFFLKKSRPIERVQDYKSFFNKAELNLQRINPRDCF